MKNNKIYFELPILLVILVCFYSCGISTSTVGTYDQYGRYSTTLVATPSYEARQRKGNLEATEWLAEQKRRNENESNLNEKERSLPDSIVSPKEQLRILERTKKHMKKARDNASHSENGLSRARPNRKWGFIDSAGKFIIPPIYKEAGYEWGDGMLPVSIDGHKWGYIDVKGNMVIQPRFKWANLFSEDLAMVRVFRAYSYSRGYYGYIDKEGNMVIPPKYHYGLPFTQGLAAVDVPHENWGYINTKGTIVIPAKFSKARRFYEGLAPVKLNDKWGFINMEGTMVIPPKYVDSFSFSNGLALVKISKEKWGYINVKGKMIIILPAQFSLPRSFKEGLARVRLKDKFGYININGEIVIKAIYSSALDFKNGRAEVRLPGGNLFFINKNGERL